MGKLAKTELPGQWSPSPAPPGPAMVTLREQRPIPQRHNHYHKEKSNHLLAQVWVSGVGQGGGHLGSYMRGDEPPIGSLPPKAPLSQPLRSQEIILRREVFLSPWRHKPVIPKESGKSRAPHTHVWQLQHRQGHRRRRSRWGSWQGGGHRHHTLAHTDTHKYSLYRNSLSIYPQDLVKSFWGR